MEQKYSTISKMKIIRLFLLLVSFLLVINTASAITTYGEFQNGLSSININDGDQVYFDFALFSINPLIKYNVKMYDINTNLVKTFVDSTSSNNLVSDRYFITQADYINNARYSIIIDGTDAVNDADSTILTLQIGRGFNNAPILNLIGNKQIDEGQLLQFTITATDQDNDSLTLTTNALPQGAVFTDNNDGTGSFTWMPSFTQSGTYNVRFTASDGQFADFEDIIITVNDITANNFPNVIINAPQQNEAVSGIYDIIWTATDPDQPANTLDMMIEYTYNGYPWQALETGQDNNDGTFTWDTAGLSNANDYTLRVTAIDDQGNPAIDTVLLTLDNQFTPNINIIAPVENEVISGMYNILWQATDSDQDPQTLDTKIEYRDPDNPNSGILSRVLNLFGIALTHWITLEDSQDNNDGALLWDTTQILNANYQLRIIATDDDGNTATGFINLFSVNNIIPQTNNNPVITSVPITNSAIYQQYNYDVEAFDPDNDLLTYSLTMSPLGMNIDVSTGLILWIPTTIGDYNVVVRVSDNNGGFADQAFIINVLTQGITVFGRERHDFMISNVILKQDNNDLSVLVHLDNNGNREEELDIIITDAGTGKIIKQKFDLDIHQGTWRFIPLKNIEKGRHIIKVEAISKAFKSSRYGYIYIN